MSSLLSTLRRDEACCRDLNWRTALPPAFAGERLEKGLGRRGWSSRSRHSVLKVLRHPEGHELAWVVDTGRVQIRVHITVPPDERRVRAESLYGELCDCLEPGDDT